MAGTARGSVAKGRHLNVILDQELDALVRQDAKLRGISVSAAVRDALRAYCQAQKPPIPALFESCVHGSADEAGLGPLNHSAAFLQKPYPLKELRAQIDRLVRTSLDTQDEADPCGSDGDLLTDDQRLSGPSQPSRG